MRLTDHIEELIVKDSEGYFDDDEDLHVTIRIAEDFYNFLQRFGDTPPPEEITYVSDTIRSGMDALFLLAQSCRAINTPDETWHFAPHRNWNFVGMRQAFLQGFERLANTPDRGPAQRLSWLLELGHLELVFLAQYFPEALFRELRENSQHADKTERT
jgi:hypothetical protein